MSDRVRTIPAVAAMPQPRRRRWLLVAGAIVAAIAAGAYGWSWYTTPALPEVDLAAAAPAVAEAIETALQEVRRSPRSGRAWGELGLALFANEFGAQAHLCFIQAERFDPESARWPYLQARRLLVDDRQAAVLALRRAVAHSQHADRQHGTADLVLAEALFENDERAEAAALCGQVLVADPGNARAEFNLGLIALAEDKLETAIEHLTRCCVSPFAGKRSAVYLASAYQRLGDAASAAVFNRRAREQPEDRPWPDAYVLQAQQYAAGPNRHFQHAQQLVGTARTGEYLNALRELAEESGDGVAHYRLGMALARMDDYVAAEPVLRTALRKSPDLIGAHYLLGIALLEQGKQLEAQAAAAAPDKFRAAVHHLRRATELQPAHGQAHLFLGHALQSCGRAAEALIEFRAAVQCRPEVAETQLALGEALAVAGERAEATRHLEQAQSLAPADPRPPAALARLRSTGTKTPAPPNK